MHLFTYLVFSCNSWSYFHYLMYPKIYSLSSRATMWLRRIKMAATSTCRCCQTCRKFNQKTSRFKPKRNCVWNFWSSWCCTEWISKIGCTDATRCSPHTSLHSKDGYFKLNMRRKEGLTGIQGSAFFRRKTLRSKYVSQDQVRMCIVWREGDQEMTPVAPQIHHYDLDASHDPLKTFQTGLVLPSSERVVEMTSWFSVSHFQATILSFRCCHSLHCNFFSTTIMYNNICYSKWRHWSL